MRAPLDHPVAAAALSLGVALAVVGLAWSFEGGDVSRFVRAARPFADPALVPRGLTVTEAGYDGMFYYRLALDPLTTARTEHGITLDLPAYRQQRIVYPLLAWIASAGDADRLPAALVAVNVLGLAAIGWLGGLLARAAGRHALWGVLFAAYPGFVMTLTRDLTEIVAAVALLGAIVLLRARRTLGAALAMTLGVLARETTALFAAAALADALTARPRRIRASMMAALPLVVVVGAQLALAARWHATATAEGAGAVGLPLLGLLGALWFDPQRYGAERIAPWIVVLAFVAVLLVTGARSLRAGAARRGEVIAWLGYALLATVFEVNIWATGAVLRALTELAMLTVLFALALPARWRWALLWSEAATGAVLLLAGQAI